MNETNQPTTSTDFRPKPEELRTSFAKSGRLLIVLSAFIIALKLAEVKLEKISLAGADFSVQQPFVVVGALGLILIYLSVRYIAQIASLMLMALAVRQQNQEKKSNRAQPVEWFLMGIVHLLVGLSWGPWRPLFS